MRRYVTALVLIMLSLGSSGWDDDGVVPRAVRAIKEAVPDLVVITDVCMCEYTDHGH